MIKNEVDALTLQYFVNNKFEKSIAPENDKSGLVITSVERKFYKKRILQLMKDLFKKRLDFDSRNKALKKRRKIVYLFIRSCLLK